MINGIKHTEFLLHKVCLLYELFPNPYFSCEILDSFQLYTNYSNEQSGRGKSLCDKTSHSSQTTSVTDGHEPKRLGTTSKNERLQTKSTHHRAALLDLAWLVLASEQRYSSY